MKAYGETGVAPSCGPARIVECHNNSSTKYSGFGQQIFNQSVQCGEIGLADILFNNLVAFVHEVSGRLQLGSVPRLRHNPGVVDGNLESQLP